jgi:hypothetical protein
MPDFAHFVDDVARLTEERILVTVDENASIRPHLLFQILQTDEKLIERDRSLSQASVPSSAVTVMVARSSGSRGSLVTVLRQSDGQAT